jgi:UDP-glucose 4-epimerase
MLGNLLVTGGCGFIGANLVRRVAQRNLARTIRVVDDESLGSRSAIAGAGAEFVQGDIRDADLLRRTLRGVDAVVHLAADTRVIDSIADPARNFDVNVVGTFRLLALMREAGVPRLVNASTGGAILGEAPPPVHEEMAPRPASPYGAAKASAEAYCSAFAQSYGLQAVSLRFSNAYGPLSFHKGSVVAAFMRRILDGAPLVVYGDGSQRRDYVFVDDLCDGIVAAMTAGAVGTFQLGSGTGTSLTALIDHIAAVVGPANCPRVRHEPFRAGEIRHTWADVTKAREGLGWTPRTALPDGLARTWAWFREQARRRGAPALR